jgi:hypothetical protein
MAARKSPKDAKWLAQRARELAAGSNALFHGTRYPNMILTAGALEPDTIGDPAICFTRSPEAAAYWATMERDTDEGRGAIFVFDRARLAMRYRLQLFEDSLNIDECEERVYDRSVELYAALLGFVSQPIPLRMPQDRRSASNEKTFRIFDLPGGELAITRAMASLGKNFENLVLGSLTGGYFLSAATAGRKKVTTIVHEIDGRPVSFSVKRMKSRRLPAANEIRARMGAPEK